MKRLTILWLCVTLFALTMVIVALVQQFLALRMVPPEFP